MPALSPSRAADFMQCPLLYRFRVLDRLPEPPSPAMARGTLVHDVLEHLFELPAPERTQEQAAALIEPTWQRMRTERPDYADLVDAEDQAALATWYAEAQRLIERWFTMEDPTRLEPAERELYVETDLDGLTLRGYVDRLDISPDGRMRVVDYKTGKSPGPAFESKALFQMKFYGLVLWRMRGQMPARLQLVYLGNGEILTLDPVEQDLTGLARKVTALWKAIEQAATTGEFRPNKSKLCSWCTFQEICPAWGGTPPPLPDTAKLLALDPTADSAAHDSREARAMSSAGPGAIAPDAATDVPTGKASGEPGTAIGSATGSELGSPIGSKAERAEQKGGEPEE